VSHRNKRTVLGLSVAIAVCSSSVSYAVEFGAFGDIRYSRSTLEGEHGAFALGGFDLYATQKIDENTRAFVEYVFEDTGEGFVIDLERLSVTRKFSDALNVGAGRIHNPLGHWNRTYHHGVLIQDTVSRPSFIDFEDGEGAVLPMHVVGLTATGEFDNNFGLFGYEAAIGNASSIDTSIAGFAASADNKPEIDVNNISSPAGAKMISLRVTAQPHKSPIKLGIFGMTNPVSESSETGVADFGSRLVDQRVVGLDLRYAAGAFDLLGEYFHMSNDNRVAASGEPVSHTASAYFVQAGYRVMPSTKLVYRYEDLSFTAEDSYFQLLGTQEASHHVVALRYDLDESNALMFEVNRTELEDGNSYTTYVADWAFLLF